MFRLVFNPSTCAWEVQLLRFGFWWATVKTPRLNELLDAQVFCKTSGLSAHYREQLPFNPLLISNVPEQNQ